MRLLLWSDLAETGFGRVGRELATRFIDLGVDVKVLAINHRGLAGELAAVVNRPHSLQQAVDHLVRLEQDPLLGRIIPASLMGDVMGHNIIPGIFDGSLLNGWTPEAVLCVADPRAMSERIARCRRQLESVPTWDYVPVEGANLPPAWRSLWTHVQPVAMSEFGKHELEHLLDRPVANIPHGASETFWPISPTRLGGFGDKVLRSKDDAKKALDLEGYTVFLRTDRLVLRKNYPALFRTMLPVLEADPSNLLLVHCAPADEGGNFAELTSEMAGAYAVGDQWLHPQVRFTGGHDTFHGWNDEQMNALVNAADVYVSPTAAEGFGLTLLEAAACGVPVVTTNYAAGPEAVGPGGILVEPSAYYTNTAAHDWALVNEPAFSDAVLTLASNPALRVELGRKGVAHAAQFNWNDTAAKFMVLMN